MAKLNYYKFTSNKNDKFQIVAQEWNTALERFKKESPFFVGSIKKIDVTPVENTGQVAIIDYSTSTVHFIDVPTKFSSEQMEEHLVQLGFKLSEISWGVFNEFIDERINT